MRAPLEYQPQTGFESRQSCLTEAAARVDRVIQNDKDQAFVRGDPYTIYLKGYDYGTDTGHALNPIVRFYCFPDTFDPRDK